MAKHHLRWLSKNNMPYPQYRNDYSWVELHNHCTDLENQLEKLNLELEAIRNLSPALADVERSFVESYKNHRELIRIRELRLFIKMNYGHPDPVGQLKFLPPDNILRIPEISESEMEKAFADLKPSWPKKAITAKSRKKRTNEIREKIESIKTELAKYPDYPKWQGFLDHWRSIQASCDAAITPQGFPLQTSPIPDEIEAFKKLGLGQLVDPSNRYHPART